MSMEDKLIKTAIHPEHGRGAIIRETEERLFVKWEDSDHPHGWFMRIDMEYVVVEEKGSDYTMADADAFLFDSQPMPVKEDPMGYGIALPESIDLSQFDLNLMDQTDPPPIVSPNSIMLSPEEEDELVERIEKVLRDDSHEALKDDEDK